MLIGIILLVMLIVPSKKKIKETGIVYIPPMAKTGQYLLGFIAIGLSIGLIAFYVTQKGEWWNLLNAGFVGPLGFMLIYNSFSSSKLVDRIAAMEDDEERVEAAELEEEEEEVVKVKEVKPAAKKKAESKTVTIQCPGCDKYLKIEMTGGTTAIKCPSCGLEGEVG